MYKSCPMLRTNEKHLVRVAVEGKIAPAMAFPNTVGRSGDVINLPGMGSIAYNVKVGDCAFGWAADHVEPCVSSVFDAEKRREKPNLSYNFLACIGNEVRVLSGAAKGAKGVVTGHHGGAEHVMIDFAPKVLDRLSSDDRLQIRAFGQGLKLLDFNDIGICSIDPSLLKRLGIKKKGAKLEVPVTAIIPGKLMGSGLGESNTFSGDYDMMTSDAASLARHRLGRLCLGDVVAIADHDASYGWRYLSGAVIIGVVIHGDSGVSGHGPGISTIMTSPTGRLSPRLRAEANIGRYLRLGRYRRN